jgi:glutamate formiminotransferase/formiminotetrahydrofolate cyclodeaminase
LARAQPFRDESFAQLVLLIAARTPTPGGGTAAALAGALGAGLACMALRFSLKRKEAPAESDAVVGAVEGGLLDLVKRFEQLADADSDAFEAVRAARKLPQGSDAERAARDAAVAAAGAEAVEVPLRTLRLARDGLELIVGVLSALNRNLATDAASGAILLEGGARCAALNVEVNLVGDGSARAKALRSEVDRVLSRCEELERAVATWTKGVLGPA